MLALMFSIIFGLTLASNGGYTDWSACSDCSLECGGGTQTFIRTCVPLNDEGCSELEQTVKTESCNDQECPLDGGYTDWSISGCSVTCGGGIQTLTRTCTNPPPANGGKNCSGLGPSEEEVSCNEQECPINGGYSEWLKCTECNVTCGGGTQILTRTCTNPPPAKGGQDCSGLGPAVKKGSCNEHECPPSCKAGLDIALVVDRSKSINEANLGKAAEFLEDLVDKFNPGPDEDHFGLITFSSGANTAFTFADSEYQDKEAIKQEIANRLNTREKGTRTDLALRAADELFTQAGGDRAGKPNIMIVLTDGNPYPPQKPTFEEVAKEIAKSFQAKHIYIVAVGIGKRINEENLRLIAGVSDDEDGTDRVVLVENFDKLQTKIEEIKESACTD